MTHCLMLLQTTFPPDIRVENEIDTLAAAGYDVHLICKNSGTQPPTEPWHSATIHRIPNVFGKSILGKIFQAPLFFNPIWLWQILKVTKKYRIKIIHVHDLPLTPMALGFKVIFGVSTIYDMHENYPAALKVWDKKGIEAILKSHHMAKRLEYLIARKFDRFIAVIEENEQRFIMEYGIRKDQIKVISNLVVLSKYQPNHAYADFKFPPNRRVLVYTGGLDIHRGLGLTLEMFEILIQTRKDVFLLVVGGGRSAAGQIEEKKLRNEIASNPQLRKSVHITGWVDFKYLPWIVQKCDVCLLPQESNPHTDTTIPHKIFQYMAMGKPVVAADAIPVKRIILETQAGLVFPSGNSNVYAEAVNRILNDPDSISYGERGRVAVQEKYNWGIAAKKLLELYTGLG